MEYNSAGKYDLSTFMTILKWTEEDFILKTEQRSNKKAKYYIKISLIFGIQKRNPKST